MRTTVRIPRSHCLPRMPLIFLRHTKPYAPEGLCYGRTDLALAPGFGQAAQRLCDALPPVNTVISSPLSRCRVLAQTIAKNRDLSIKIDYDLIEMDFGAWENTLWGAIDRTELDTWADDFFHAKPHGGESVSMLQDRVRSALTRLDNSTTLWVSHAGVYRALMAETDHLDPWNARIDFAHFEAVNLS